MAYLCLYSWPGNVRELEAAIERMAVFSHGATIGLADLPAEILNFKVQQGTALWDIPDNGLVFEDIERDILSKALLKTNGNMTTAAKLLGMSYRAFRYRANTFGIRGA